MTGGKQKKQKSMETIEKLMEIRKAGIGSLTCIMSLVELAGGDKSMGYLAVAAGVSSAAITGAVDTLVEQELATRYLDPNDRRLVMVAGTEKGKELVADL